MTSKQLLDHDKMRWSLAAHDICFSKPLHSAFFSHGKCVPTVRGLGVYQKAVDFCIHRMNDFGDWVHVFPEGKVNMERDKLHRLKWGVGRMVAECQTTPVVIPFWHVGMADILPNKYPYIPRIGKTVLLNIGEPIDIKPVVDSVADKSALEKRKVITDFIQSKMAILREETLVLAGKK
jgi:monolysocardiolipin acyltransferase